MVERVLKLLFLGGPIVCVFLQAVGFYFIFSAYGMPWYFAAPLSLVLGFTFGGFKSFAFGVATYGFVTTVGWLWTALLLWLPTLLIVAPVLAVLYYEPKSELVLKTKKGSAA